VDSSALEERLRAAAAVGGQSRQTAHEYSRDAIRRAILNGEIDSGTRLVQADLAVTLDVSTTPVREALRDLAAEGLVRFDPHRGAVVAEMTGEDLQEIYDLRQLVEPHALRQAVPKLTDETIAALERLHERMTNEPHSAQWVDHNRAFHMMVYESAATPRLAAIIRGLEDSAVMYIGAGLRTVPELRDDAIRDHAELLDALRERDADKAVTVIKRHLGIPLRALGTSLDR
jgi:DNA-binding GntR family transcriptional regulator